MPNTKAKKATADLEQIKKEYESISQDLISQAWEWENTLLTLPNDIVTERKNHQQRSIRQLVGHMIDAASNYTHRVIHLQMQPSPLIFPDYSNHGNNDRWISIQCYQEEDWYNLVQLWKYSHLHFAHVIMYIDLNQLENIWVSGIKEKISLHDTIAEFPRHFKLHIEEITELMYR